MRKVFMFAAVLAGVLAVASSCRAQDAADPGDGKVVKLTAKAVADPKGDGPDGKGNTIDDTWGFWFQLIHAPRYRRLDIATATMSAAQKKNGIPRKVTGPIGKYLPNPDKTEGWIYHSDWDGRYEGVWGDEKVNQVVAHPYNEKSDGGAVAVTYKVPEDGTYAVTVKVTDMNPAKGHRTLTGITAIVDIVNNHAEELKKPVKELKRVKVGDDVGPKSAELKIEKVALKKGQLVRLVIDPNKWWGGDMTRIDTFTIERVK